MCATPDITSIDLTASSADAAVLYVDVNTSSQKAIATCLSSDMNSDFHLSFSLHLILHSGISNECFTLAMDAERGTGIEP